jgi:hypothetical protein
MPKSTKQAPTTAIKATATGSTAILRLVSIYNPIRITLGISGL